MKRAGKKSIKIVAATAVTIFSLFALFSGVMAWFMAAARQSSDHDHFKVTTFQVEIDSIELYKFEYNKMVIGGVENYDYLKPQDGSVHKYSYNETEGTFGYTDNQSHWVDVDVMNIYDPVDQLISSHNLIDMNCNVVFAVHLTSNDFVNAYAHVDSDRLTEKSKTNRQIYLTDCADFDVFTETDLLDSNSTFSDGEGDEHLYYPSYISHSNSMTEPSKTYYKCSYLSSLAQSHAHYYGTDPKPERIPVARNKAVTFVDGAVTLYVNVNYAPQELSKYAKEIYTRNILAVYDFSFEFSITNEVVS